MTSHRDRWRVALIDSCGEWSGACAAAAFQSDGRTVRPLPARTDPTGHGSRIARILTDGERIDLLLGQVFLDPGPTSGAAVAAAIDWAVDSDATLIHLSLGLAHDRSTLAQAVTRARAAGRIVVAAAPARGAPVFPASYEGVIRASGDARCAPGELSCLDAWHFGACPRLATGEGGASIGAAHVTHALVRHCAPGPAADIVAALGGLARYRGRERRGAAIR